MNYQESIAWLTETAAFGIQPGLQRIEALLEGLGHPENAFKSIHVAGTNALLLRIWKNILSESVSMERIFRRRILRII